MNVTTAASAPPAASVSWPRLPPVPTTWGVPKLPPGAAVKACTLVATSRDACVAPGLSNSAASTLPLDVTATAGGVAKPLALPLHVWPSCAAAPNGSPGAVIAAQQCVV